MTRAEFGITTILTGAVERWVDWRAKMTNESTVSCECGEWSGEACQWSGPESETVVVEFMPDYLRSSHDPHNGAVRVRVERSCAEHMLEHDRNWVTVIDAQGDVRLVQLGSGLVPGAATKHESAEDMWDSLGWHADWQAEHDSGQVAHPVCTVDQIDELDDEALLAAVCPEDACEEERDAYREAIEYARGALDDMRAIESELERAVSAYERGDGDECREALDSASRLESEYGDDPAARALRDALIAPEVQS